MDLTIIIDWQDKIENQNLSKAFELHSVKETTFCHWPGKPHVSIAVKYV